jgi:peptide chain release factor 1
LFEKLTEVEKRFEQIQQSLMEPGVTDNQERYRSMMKELSDLEKVVVVFRQFKKTREELEGNKHILETENDEDLREMAKEDIGPLETRKASLEDQLKILLLPTDPNDEKNIIMEIRAGAGGDEASLFAMELFRAYTHFATQRGWRVEVMSISDGNVGGYKEVLAQVTGEKVYSLLKYESGVHRVQRVPKTEAQGRVHTSTVTVAIIPEAEEREVKIDQKDLRIDVMRASGAGGQSVNRTESAVRVTHLPSGLVVYCQEGKSQHANKDKALKILFSRLKQREEEKVRQEASDARLEQIGTGDRSERIRTYNFPQSRISDHRIGLTIHSLGEVMNGAFDPLIEPLVAHHQAEALKQQTQT